MDNKKYILDTTKTLMQTLSNMGVTFEEEDLTFDIIENHITKVVNNLPIQVVPELVCECLHQKWIDGVRTCQNKKCGKEFKTD